jgi:hypothetical protein
MGFETALVLGEGVTHVLHAARELPLADGLRQLVNPLGATSTLHCDIYIGHDITHKIAFTCDLHAYRT